jgi:hypothetical protein
MARLREKRDIALIISEQSFEDVGGPSASVNVQVCINAMRHAGGDPLGLGETVRLLISCIA